MSWEWEERLNSIIEEAREVLAENNLPSNSDELYDIEAPNLLVSSAIKIILNAEYLFKEIEKNRTGHALNRLFKICADHEDLFILKHAKQFKNGFYTTDQFIHSLTSSYKGGIKGRDEAKKQHSERLLEYQSIVDKVAKDHPSWKITVVRDEAASLLGISRKTLENNNITPSDS